MREQQNLEAMGQSGAGVLNDLSFLQRQQDEEPVFKAVKMDGKGNVKVEGNIAALQGLMGRIQSQDPGMVEALNPAAEQAQRDSGPQPTLGQGAQAIAAADAQGGFWGALKGLAMRAGRAGGGLQNFDRRQGIGNLLGLLGAVPQGEAMYQQEKAGCEDRLAGYKMRMAQLEEGIRDGRLNRHVATLRAERETMAIRKMAQEEKWNNTVVPEDQAITSLSYIPEEGRGLARDLMRSMAWSVNASTTPGVERYSTTNADMKAFAAWYMETTDFSAKDRTREQEMALSQARATLQINADKRADAIQAEILKLGDPSDDNDAKKAKRQKLQKELDLATNITNRIREGGTQWERAVLASETSLENTATRVAAQDAAVARKAEAKNTIPNEKIAGKLRILNAAKFAAKNRDKNNPVWALLAKEYPDLKMGPGADPDELLAAIEDERAIYIGKSADNLVSEGLDTYGLPKSKEAIMRLSEDEARKITQAMRRKGYTEEAIKEATRRWMAGQ